MKIFEFHFNPKVKENVIYDSFIYEPENVDEKGLGNLYMVGELTNLLPQNVRFLDNLALTIKKEYYAGIQRQPEQNLREGLRKANDFLAEEAKKENVSWLGNLNLAILSIKDFVLNFTKVGSLKILLIRGEEILDISQNLEFQDAKPYPLKVFGNIAVGKLAPDDRIMILTRDVFELFERENLIKELSSASEEKKLKDILRTKEKALSEISGICLLAILTPVQYAEAMPEKKHSQVPVLQEKKNYPPQKIYQYMGGAFSLITNPLKFIFKGVSQKVQNVFNIFGVGLRSLFKKPFEGFKFFIKSRNIISVLFLILLLVLGFYVFKGERAEEQKLAQLALDTAESKFIQAESILILKDIDRANILFKESWDKILPLTETGAPLREKALIFKELIEEQLAVLNKLEKIERPEILFEFQPKEINLIPQKMVAFDSGLYFFNPFSANLYKLDVEKNIGTTIKADKSLFWGTASKDFILFFSRPDTLFSLKNGEWIVGKLEMPYPDFVFNSLAIFKSNIYLLDNKNGEIIKYPPLNFEEGEEFVGKLWLKPKPPPPQEDGGQVKKLLGAKSITVDGNIWILTKDNKIDRYYGGLYKETLKFDVFPYLENPTKIWTSKYHPYLYLLEAKKNRIVILTKYGEIVKQYQSEKFDDLLDFAVSEDGETIWLLNGLEVYQIKS